MQVLQSLWPSPNNRITKIRASQTLMIPLRFLRIWLQFDVLILHGSLSVPKLSIAISE